MTTPPWNTLFICLLLYVFILFFLNDLVLYQSLKIHLYANIFQFSIFNLNYLLMVTFLFPNAYLISTLGCQVGTTANLIWCSSFFPFHPSIFSSLPHFRSGLTTSVFKLKFLLIPLFTFIHIPNINKPFNIAAKISCICPLLLYVQAGIIPCPEFFLPPTCLSYFILNVVQSILDTTVSFWIWFSIKPQTLYLKPQWLPIALLIKLRSLTRIHGPVWLKPAYLSSFTFCHLLTQYFMNDDDFLSPPWIFQVFPHSEPLHQLFLLPGNLFSWLFDWLIYTLQTLAL